MAMVLAGEIGIFAFGFVPGGWARCDGQTLAIADYGDLFAVLGTTFGGDGEKGFAVPDLNGRVTVNAGQGPETSGYALAQQAGADSVTLVDTHLPSHLHTMYGGLVSPANPAQNEGQPTPGAMFGYSHPKFLYGAVPLPIPALGMTGLHPDVIGTVGGSAPHANAQPFLTLSFCIALSDLD